MRLTRGLVPPRHSTAASISSIPKSGTSSSASAGAGGSTGVGAGTDAYSQWAGTKVVLFPTETTFKGDTVACVRVAAPKTKAAVPSPVPVDAPVPADADEEEPDFGIDEIDAAVL